MLNPLNKKAPDFELKDQDGNIHKLSDYKGKRILLYFYPKDMTPGCTVEACGFRDNMRDLKKLGVTILGVSADDEKSHKKFEEKERLNFTLLADTNKDVAKKYGVWVEKSMYGKKYFGIQRDSFLIDEEGVIVRHYEKVKPEDHVAEVLADVEAL